MSRFQDLSPVLQVGLRLSARWRALFVFGGTDFCRGVVHALLECAHGWGGGLLAAHGALDFIRWYGGACLTRRYRRAGERLI